MFTKWLIYLGVASAIAGMVCYLATYAFLKEDRSHFDAFMRGSFQSTSDYTETGRRLVIANRWLAIIALTFLSSRSSWWGRGSSALIARGPGR